MAHKPAGPARLAMFVGGPLLNMALRRLPANLRSYPTKRFAIARQ